MNTRSLVVMLSIGSLASITCACEEKTKSAGPAASASALPAAASAAPSAAKPSPAELIERTVSSGVEAWNSHDPARVAALFEHEATVVIEGAPPMTGGDAIAAEAKQDFAAYPDFKVAVTRLFVHGTTGVFEWVITGKNDGPFMGQKPTGRQMGVAGVSVATFDEEGLIKQEHRYCDLPTIQSQLDPTAKAGTFRTPLVSPTAPMETHVSKGTPDETKTMEQGDAVISAFEGKNESKYMATVTDDYVLEDETTPGPQKAADLKAGMTSLNKAFPDWTDQRSMMMAADGYFVAEVVLTGTQKGPLGPMKATNKPINVHGVDIQLLADGKVRREWEYANTAEMLIELGMMPAPSSPR
jgi:steroid delta-isomerase-like uncharacterized protein